MAWHNVADGVIPKILEVVEVELANGSAQLALFSGEHWRTPTVKGLPLDQSTTEIKNVIKWRPFAEGIADRQKAKVPFNARPYN